NGASGHRSLLALTIIATVAALAWARAHDTIVNPLVSRDVGAATDEVLVVSITAGAGVAMLLALLDRWLRLGLLSRLTRRVTLMLIPPLVLIFLVLGTIFLGLATPTEGGAMGALGALVMTAARGRLN